MVRTRGVSLDAASREGEAEPLPGFRLRDEPEALRRRLAGLLVIPVGRGVPNLPRDWSHLMLKLACRDTL
jgi:hypothetical protein